jgi:hypothetical protein
MYTFHYTEEPARKEARWLELGDCTDGVTKRYKSTGKETHSRLRQGHKLAAQGWASVQNSSFYVFQTT